MDSEGNEIKDSQIYEKPKLRVIDLAAEEVLAVGCKTLTSNGPLVLCSDGSNCASVGS